MKNIAFYSTREFSVLHKQLDVIMYLVSENLEGQREVMILSHNAHL